MGRPRERKPRAPQTDTQQIFVRRVLEEMGDLSVSALAKRSKMNQKALNSVLKDGAVPKLTAIHKIALGLGKHVWELFTDVAEKNQEILTTKVHQIRPPAGKLLTPHKHRTPGQMTKRNKSRG